MPAGLFLCYQSSVGRVRPLTMIRNVCAFNSVGEARTAVFGVVHLAYVEESE